MKSCKELRNMTKEGKKMQDYSQSRAVELLATTI
jgi:hypothetical protein